MDPWKAALYALALLAFFVAGVFVGTTEIAPAQADARAEVPMATVTVEPPTRSRTEAAILHACREADVSLGALVERLEQTEPDWSEVER